MHLGHHEPITYVDDDLAHYHRQLSRCERAPLEHRMTDSTKWAARMAFLQARVAELELERELLLREAALLEVE